MYAGHARELSARSCVPQLYRALAEGQPLTEAARRASSAVSSTDRRQVFGAPAGGMGGLPQILRDRLEARGVDVLTGARVTSITRAPAFKDAWHLEVERDDLAEPYDVDAVLLATPASVAAQLLPAQAEAARAPLSAVEHASMAIVTYAFPASLAARLPDGTGFLVPAVDGHAIKASTFSSVKWPWLTEHAPELTYVRVSLGRHREADVLERSDAELVDLGLADLRQALGLDDLVPVDTHVMRWWNGLPQYPVGHGERMETVRAAVAPLPRLEVAGAYLDGVGIPACVATARSAATAILTDLDHPTPDPTPIEGEGR